MLGTLPRVHRFLPLLVRRRPAAGGKRRDLDWSSPLVDPDDRRRFEEWHRQVIVDELLGVVSVSGDEP
jgi:hypothetical protein